MAKSYKNKKNSYTRKFKGGCGGTCPILKGGYKKKKTGSKKKRGGDATILSLAYPGSNYLYQRNPHLAYTGTGQSYPGVKGGRSNNYSNPNIGAPNNKIVNAYPNPGPTPTGFGFLNPSQTQYGGNYKYPNGLTGETWRWDINSWPGVKPIDSNGNHYSLNTYKNDVSRQMIDVGPAFPFVSGGARKKRSKKKGGVVLNDNSLVQDLVNAGRQIKTGFGGIYDGLNGYQAPVSPLPWKGQLTNTGNMTSMKYKV
jgi:hypothetical protein